MRIEKEESAGLVIDIQERLFPHMDQHALLLENMLVLLKGLAALEVPVLLTEQYPKGLGPTLEEIRQSPGIPVPIIKGAFSCCDEPAFRMTLEQTARRKVIICGIEAHVCVLQTVIDLLEYGYVPVVVADCISSRKAGDKELALERMRTEGAVVTSMESILFELARVSGTEEFKTISRLVK
ncbi:MAG TPA: hydrolase [Bacteroides sp.]|nr:hydrolase [Bacteroides sp.]